MVTNYRALNDASYYDNFSQGNEDLNGPPELEIDPLTGDLTWNAPGQELNQKDKAEWCTGSISESD